MASSADHMLEMVSFQFGFQDSDIFTPRPNSNVNPNLLPNGNGTNNMVSLPQPWSHHLLAPTDRTDSETVISPCHQQNMAQAKDASPFSDQCIYRRQYPSPDQGLARPTQEPASLAQTETPQPQRHRRIVLGPSPSKDMSSQSTWRAEILDINSELWDLASSVPYLDPSDDGDGDGGDVYTCTDIDTEQDEGRGFPIDAMFKLSRRLLQNLKDVKPGGDAEACRGEGVPFRIGPVEAPLDPGTGLLILSTYVLLLDLYQKVFRIVQVDISLSKSRDMFRLCKLPNVSVGSFPVSPSPSLQMELTIRLARQFLFQLRATAASLGSQSPSPVLPTDPGTSQSSALSRVVEVSLREIMAKEKQIDLELDKTRVKLAGMSSPASEPSH